MFRKSYKKLYCPAFFYSVHALFVLFFFVILPNQFAHANELIISDNEPIPNILDYMSLGNNSQENGKVDADQWHVTITSSLAKPVIWRLSTETLKPLNFDFYQVADDEKKLIFSSYARYTPLKTRASQGRIIQSPPIIINPGESIKLVAIFEARTGDDIYPIKFTPEASYDEERFELSILHGAYLGGAIIFLAFFIAFSVLLSSPPARYYAIYFSALSILTFHSYGYGEHFFSSNIGSYYFLLFRPLQVAIMLSYLFFAISFLKASENYPRLHKFTLAYIILNAVLVFVETFYYQKFFTIIVSIIALGFLSIGILTAFLALRDKHKGAVFFATGYAVLLANGVINYIASYNAFAAFNNKVDALTLFLQLSDAFIFAAAMISQTWGLRQDRDSALKEKLIATEEKLAVSEELRSAERDRDTAIRLAERHRSRFAATSHDMRQPLSSLKLVLEDLQGARPEVKEKLSSGINYLNEILGSSLDEIEAEATTNKDEPTETNNNREDMPLQLIFDNIERMFSEEAAAKGLKLHFVQTSMQVNTAPIALIRILSNLVGNAIKYTPSGRIVVGARRRGEKVAIQVWDTGSGVDDASLKKLMEPFVRGRDVDEQEGYGLGFAIVQRLVSVNKLSFHGASISGKGSVFTVGEITRVNSD